MASFDAIGKTTPAERQLGRRPSAEQAARRLIILRHVVVYALTSPHRVTMRRLLRSLTEEDRETLTRETELARNEVWGYIQDSGLWKDMSPWERAYSRCTMVTMSHRQQVEASWRMESVQVLVWALGFLTELPAYGVQADQNVLDQLSVEPVDDFIKSVRLRPRAEIAKARDVAELWARRSRAWQLMEDGLAFYPDPKLRAAGYATFNTAGGATGSVASPDLVVNGKAYRDLELMEWSDVHSITMERQLTLNWLCGYVPDNRWDESFLHSGIA